MADVITRFKLETTQYDSKLRNASKDLSEYARRASLAGKDFDKFTKSNVDAARAFGNIQTSATNAKDKVKELVGAYNDMAKAWDVLTKDQQQSDWAKAMAESMNTLKGRIAEAKQELYGMNEAMSKGGGGFGDILSGKMTMASFKGNLYAMAAEKGTEMLGSLKDKITDILKESVKLSKEAEGIEIAFNRLNRPDLLDKLKEATHGTVSEIELMKQAVKFNDFRLNLDEMGTLLAFAQQKAKDTGQSIDYMVDSIVTGLGRQSLMILDNLGLSAAEIKEKMKGTGDMTKAVAEIIKDQMAKAGDYVETAADRAAKATVSVQNEMKHLGDMIREAFDVESIESLSSILEVRLIKDLEDIVGVISDLSTGFGLFGTDASSALNTVADAAYWVVKQVLWLQTGLLNIARLVHWIKGDSSTTTGQQQQAVKDVLSTTQSTWQSSMLPEVVVLGNKTPKRPKGGGKSATADINSQIASGWEKAMLKSNSVSSGFKVPEIFGPSDAWKAYTTDIRMGLEGIDDEMSNLTKWSKEFNPYNENLKKSAELAQQQATAQNLAAQSVANLGSALASIDDPAAKAAGTVMQAIANIALGFSAAATQAASLGPYGWIAYAAAGLSTMATVISSIHSLTGFAEGGVIKGNNYSGDNIGGLVDGNQFVGLNAGEIVLNQAQAGILASRLQENGGGGIRIVGVLKGENVVLMADRYGKRTGRGELAFWK